MRLSPTSYLVLGLIGLRGPSTPYELKRAAGRSVSYFWQFPHSQLYSEPERLAKEGLLAVEREDGGRNRKTYALTGAGRRALHDWLQAPNAELPETRDLALLQLFFSEFLDRDEVAALARTQVATHQARLRVYESIEEELKKRPARGRRNAPLRYGILMEKALTEFWAGIAEDPPEP